MRRPIILAGLFAGSLALAITTHPCAAQERRSGAPEDHLPPNITELSAFGERPAWSPDGQRIAFIGKSYGDAFEMDLHTHLIKLLSGHFKHAGLLRIQYLPNNDYLIIMARTFRDVNTTRYADEEMWIMKADASAPPVPLGQKIHEGVAISQTRNRIAWSNQWTQYPDSLAKGESVLYVADIVYDNGVPRIANRQEVLRAHQPDCTIEAQDFRDDDTKLIYTCYRENGNKADVMGLDLRTKAVTTYRRIEGEYNEAEGVSPDGKWGLVESSHDQGSADRQTFRYIDIWQLSLDGKGTFTRLTRFSDFEGRKAANPVVSPDGKSIAFQAGRATDPPGVGYGIFVLRLQ